MWKIEKTVGKGEYLYGVCKEHPNATRHGYVLMHRLVMENHLGRILDPKEVVHHENGDKKDNRIENLSCMGSCEHSRLHSQTVGKKYCLMRCPACGGYFARERRQTHLAKKGVFSACSEYCRGMFSRQIQLLGRTHEVNAAISGNLVLEYKRYFSDNPEVTETVRVP